jgi:hypothetical protein
MQIKVVVECYGTYTIDNERVPQLLSWLSSNNSVEVREQPVREVIDSNFPGKTLINEN